VHCYDHGLLGGCTESHGLWEEKMICIDLLFTNALRGRGWRLDEGAIAELFCLVGWLRLESFVAIMINAM